MHQNNINLPSIYVATPLKDIAPSVQHKGAIMALIHQWIQSLSMVIINQSIMFIHHFVELFVLRTLFWVPDVGLHTL